MHPAGAPSNTFVGTSVFPYPVSFTESAGGGCSGMGCGSGGGVVYSHQRRYNVGLSILQEGGRDQIHVVVLLPVTCRK